MRVLAFGAHPDDIEFRCGGTLAKMAARGDEIFMCIATNGNIGSFQMGKDEIRAVRHKEAQAACDLIGAQLIWLDEPDEFLFDNEKTRLKFVDAYRIARPDIVFAPPYFKDYNQDHDMTGYLAFVARVISTVKLIETEYEQTATVPPLFYTQPHGINPEFRPEYFVDITEMAETKHRMCNCHASQMGDWCRDAFGVNYLEGKERTDKYWANACGTPGVEYVEVFSLCKTWPIKAGAHTLLP